MKDELNKLTETIIGAAIEVHRMLGPGLLEQNVTQLTDGIRRRVYGFEK